MLVHQISQFGFVNAYLVAEDDGLTLVDAMLPRAQKRILAAAAELGAPIRRIALTHAHGDHVGALDALAAALPGVEVLISTRDARLLAGDKSLDPGEPQTKLRGSFPGAKTRPTRTFEPGDRVGSLEVHAGPGHTPGQVAFLDPRDGTLYAADTYSTLGGVATTAKANWRFPLPAMATWNRPLALESARAMRALAPARLAPGHGKVVERPGAAMDRAIARGAQMTDSATLAPGCTRPAALDRHPPDQVVHRVLPWSGGRRPASTVHAHPGTTAAESII